MNDMTTTSIWQKPIDLASIAATGKGTAVEHLGIEVHTILADGLVARMPVDARTRQPMGLLHGGVSVVLAETLGSLGAYFACPPGQVTVGLDINANHLRAVRSGWVTGTAKPVHLGRSTHVWAIEIANEAGQLVCVSRITMAILTQPPGSSGGVSPSNADQPPFSDQSP